MLCPVRPDEHRQPEEPTAIPACAAYVDLNPIRAALATTLERIDFSLIALCVDPSRETL